MVICLYGASSTQLDPAYFTAVEAFGRELGRRGQTLLYGGGAQGLMGAAARGTKAGGGKVIGVAPRFFDVDGILYPDCDEFIYTETMRERKAILSERADAFVAVPGGIGTFDEFFEVLTLKQLGRHNKPITLLNLQDYYAPLLAMLESAIEKGFMGAACRGIYRSFEDGCALLDYLEHYDAGALDVRHLKNI